MDVAEPDCRLRRGDTDRGNVASVGSHHSLCHCAVEAANITDHMVGGKRTDNDIRLSTHQDRRSKTDCSGRIFWLALEHNIAVDELW